MNWQEIRKKYPNRWLLVEATHAYTENEHRILEQLDVLELFAESKAALNSYRVLHKEEPNRELYVLHTDREHLNVKERLWMGFRSLAGR